MRKVAIIITVESCRCSQGRDVTEKELHSLLVNLSAFSVFLPQRCCRGTESPCKLTFLNTGKKTTIYFHTDFNFCLATERFSSFQYKKINFPPFINVDNVHRQVDWDISLGRLTPLPVSRGREASNQSCRIPGGGCVTLLCPKLPGKPPQLFNNGITSLEEKRIKSRRHLGTVVTFGRRESQLQRCLSQWFVTTAPHSTPSRS